jgi:hypothetical protein
MYIFCVYPAMSKKSENLSDLDKKDRNKRHSSPFINVVKGVFFVVRVTLVPVSYLSAPSAVLTAFYPAISTFAVQICYTNKFLLYSY